MEDSKAKFDKVFSEYIRKRDTNNGFFRCISCGGLLPYELADMVATDWIVYNWC